VSTINAQYGTERTGYEGDYFSLEGAVELFKESRSINDFERKINSKENWVNNLDLDYDGRTDYVRVEHRRKGSYHAIILQVPISRREVQDVAVIEIEEVGRRDAILQIIGDRDLYGEEVIVEPVSSYADSRGNQNSRFASNDYVNVYYWPAVQYILARNYTVYASPYRWNYYPTWWSPWNQYSWNVYYPRLRPYYRHCHIVTVYRVPHVHKFYGNHRSYSTNIARRAKEIRVKNPRALDSRKVAASNRSNTYRNGSKSATYTPKVVERRAGQVTGSRSAQTRTRSNAPTVTKRESARPGIKSRSETGIKRSAPIKSVERSAPKVSRSNERSNSIRRPAAPKVRTQNRTSTVKRSTPTKPTRSATKTTERSRSSSQKGVSRSR